MSTSPWLDLSLFFCSYLTPLPLELIARSTLQKTQSLNGYPLLCMLLVMTLVGVWYSLDHTACWR